MSLGIFDLPEDGLDPVEASSRVARTIKAAMDELKDRGIVDYLALSGSEEEFDARLASRDCISVVADVAEKHLKGFESPTETLVGQLKSAHGDHDWEKDEQKTGEPGASPLKDWEKDTTIKKRDINAPYPYDPKGDWKPKSHPDCEICNPKKDDFDKIPHTLNEEREASTKVGFNPNEDTYLLEPKCQVAGCDKDATEGGGVVCAEHNQKQNVARVAKEAGLGDVLREKATDFLEKRDMLLGTCQNCQGAGCDSCTRGFAPTKRDMFGEFPDGIPLVKFRGELNPDEAHVNYKEID